jgi:hypothetical protein
MILIGQKLRVQGQGSPEARISLSAKSLNGSPRTPAQAARPRGAGDLDPRRDLDTGRADPFRSLSPAPAVVTSTPTVKSELIVPLPSSNTMLGSSVSSAASRMTVRSVPPRAPATTTVIAIRTAAASSESLRPRVIRDRHDDRDRRLSAQVPFHDAPLEKLADRVRGHKPNRRKTMPFRVSTSAARSHQYITKSALSFMCGCADHSALM